MNHGTTDIWPAEARAKIEAAKRGRLLRGDNSPVSYSEVFCLLRDLRHVLSEIEPPIPLSFLERVDRTIERLKPLVDAEGANG